MLEHFIYLVCTLDFCVVLLDLQIASYMQLYRAIYDCKGSEIQNHVRLKKVAVMDIQKVLTVILD